MALGEEGGDGAQIGGGHWAECTTGMWFRFDGFSPLLLVCWRDTGRVCEEPGEEATWYNFVPHRLTHTVLASLVEGCFSPECQSKGCVGFVWFLFLCFVSRPSKFFSCVAPDSHPKTPPRPSRNEAAAIQ